MREEQPPVAERQEVGVERTSPGQQILSSPLRTPLRISLLFLSAVAWVVPLTKTELSPALGPLCCMAWVGLVDAAAAGKPAGKGTHALK